MSNNTNKETETTERKKISLQEAIKQKMASKQQKAVGYQTGNYSNATQKMKSQQTKKQNNQRKRTGV